MRFLEKYLGMKVSLRIFFKLLNSEEKIYQNVAEFAFYFIKFICVDMESKWKGILIRKHYTCWNTLYYVKILKSDHF